ncbi:amino acid adenylation domain-containing protein [Streptomyces sp. NBC_01591]|uniref:non-ribosomal peptide synthetase n=1 Tax=Streptomyces sp. NBC_01591 TaxID=2975888 RepID=UPI002DDBD79B|nr:amino acid adenylation domain-containing protein [Streptomyces sp. NBC_01591]WSD71850.1 amino acid adenylation domain-containing protein [Streptomyces sp. NBC_01591]
MLTPRCGAVAAQELPTPYTNDVDALASACRTSPTSVLLAGFTALLHRCSGKEIVDLHDAGTPGRLFRLPVTGVSTLRALTEAIGSPHDLTESRPGPMPIAVRLDAARTAVDDRPYELEFALSRASDASWRIELHYDERLFDAATVERLLSHYVTLLGDGLAHSDHALADLALLGREELRRILVEWNDTETVLPLGGGRLHEAFENQAELRPHMAAVVQGPTRLSYREVNAAANRLAHHLRGLGVGPDDRVALYLRHSPDLLIAMLAVLKAGGAYVPLDPDHPPLRVKALIDGAACETLITTADLVDGLAGARPGGSTVVLDRESAVLAGLPEHNPAPGARPENLCYVIHTSGSTGTPKAIAVCHRGVTNNVADLNTRFGVGPGDKILGLSSQTFDMSVYEYIGITAAGGTLVLPSPGRAKDPGHWAELATEHGITMWNTAPALLELFLERLENGGDDHKAALAKLRVALLAGDWIPVQLPDRARRHAPGLKFVALGGATEASIYSTLYKVESTDPAWTSIPYGRPMANQRAYILDDRLRPVPPGVTGQLYLAGIGLAREYLNQPALTAERFLTWSYGDISDERLYRTGDLARFGADGLIELLGRADLQVKVNGLRIELAEIETALLEHPAIKEAVVTAESGTAAGPVLVSHVVPHGGANLQAQDVRAHVAQKLPAYMVPGSVVAIERMPLNPHGKVDRSALAAAFPQAARGAAAATTEDGPASPWERRVAAVWRDVLEVEVVHRDDNFFSLGGDSMKALRIMAIDPALEWSDVYLHPTLRELSDHLQATAGDVDSSAL